MKTILSFFAASLFASTLFAAETPRLAVIPGGNAAELCALVEAKLFDNKGLELVERNEIDVVLAERKLSGLFDTANAIELGGILKADLFAALEPNSLVVFDAKTGLRFVDETLPEKLDAAAQTAAEVVGASLEKRRKFAENKLVMFGILSIRNAEFSRDRDTWCKALVRLLERELMVRDCAVLERSRLGQVIEERRLTGDNANDLLAAMKLLDLEFSRGNEPNTFKITARIGDETFRAESLIDSPLDAVVNIARQLAGTQSSAINQIDRHHEAKRFFDEANFLAGLSNYEPALERIDAAVALDYDTIRYRNKQAWLLIQHATYPMHPELARTSYDSPNTYPSVKQESFETALILVRRAVEVIDSIPGGFLGESVDEEVLERLRRTNRVLAGMIWTFVQPAQKRPMSLFPQHYENVNRLLDDTLEVWEKTYDEVVANVNDASSFAKYCKLLRYRNPFVPLQQTPKTAQLYEKLIGDLIRFTEQWQDVPEAVAARNKVCRDFAYFAADFKIARQYLDARTDGPTRTRQIEESIARVCRSLDFAPFTEFGIYSYLAQNGLEFSPDQDAPSLKDLTKIDMLKRKIASLPRDINKNDMLTLFNEAWVRCFCNSDRIMSVSDFVDFVDLANEHKTPAGHLTQELLSRINYCHSTYSHEPEKLDDIRNNLARYFKAVEIQIAIAEVGSSYPPQYLKNKLNSSRAIWNQSVTERPLKKRLWKEEVPIWKSDNVYNCLNHVRLYGDTLFMFVLERERESWSIRIDEFDSKNRVCKKGDTTSLKRSFGHDNRDSACIDAHNIFYGTHGEGVFVIPRDGSAPWRLTSEEGLPSDHVQAMAVMNGTLYIGLGKDKQESWLVSVDVKTRKVNILASSASIEAHPFSNCSPAPMYAHFELDSKRNRLFMLVKIKQSTGIWTLDGNTNALANHFQVYFGDGIKGHIVSSGDQFLIQDFYRTFLIDIDRFDQGLESIRVMRMPNGSIPSSMRSHVLQTERNFDMAWGTIWNGSFWGGLSFYDKSLRERYGNVSSFMRASLENKDDFDFLATPEGREGVIGWQFDQFCYVVNDGKDLLLGNRGEIILLRFE